MADGPFQKPALDRKPDPEFIGAEHRCRIRPSRCRRAPRLGRKQHLGIGVLRVCKNLGGRTLLHDLAVLHHTDPIRNLAHDGKIMGDEEHRHTFIPLENLQKIENLCLDRDIKSGRRFVRHQKIRPVGKRHGNHHALALTARKLVRKRPEPTFRIADTDPIKQRDDLRPRLCSRQTLMKLERLAKLLFDRMERIERGHRLLEDKADIIAPHAAKFLGRRAHHFRPVIGDRAAHSGVIPKKRHGRESRYRLARAAFPDQSHRLALVHVKAYAFDGVYVSAILTERHR